MLNLNKNITNISRIARKSILLVLILALVWQCFPRITSLAAMDSDNALKAQLDEIVPQALESVPDFGKPVRVIVVPVTAYNSEPGQTDSTPCITANGFDLCKNGIQNVIAANFLKFGTKVRFPEYDPNTIYTVQDRMNARYTYRADIWMLNKQDAKIFGLKRLTMEIYE